MVRHRCITAALTGLLLSACGAGVPTKEPTVIPVAASATPTAAPPASPSPTPTPVPTPKPVAAGRILFESSRDPRHNIFEMDPDGSHVVALPNGPHDHQPDWSPDRQRIAFIRDDQATKPGIYVMNADGSNVHLVFHDPAWYAEFPAWSPDGTQLAYAGSQGQGDGFTSRLSVVKLDGTGDRVVTDALAGSVRVAWSPDGRWILFFHDSGCDLCAIHPDGSGMHKVASLTPDSNAGFGFGTWSPDGARIAFQRDQSIVTVNPDGSGAVALTSGVADDEFVDWSPDGDWLVFERFAAGLKPQLWIMRADGTDAMSVSRDPAFSDSYPSWQ